MASVPVHGQTLQAPTVGRMSANQVGVEPAMKLPTARYVAEADALDAFVATSSRMAMTRSRDPGVLAFARRAGPAHAQSLHARGGSPAAPPELASRLDRLRAARGGEFDRLFAADQIAAGRRLWSVHTGYAADGPDPRLKRAAAAAVPLEERDLHALPMRPIPY